MKNNMLQKIMMILLNFIIFYYTLVMLENKGDGHLYFIVLIS